MVVRPSGIEVPADDCNGGCICRAPAAVPYGFKGDEVREVLGGTVRDVLLM